MVGRGDRVKYDAAYVESLLRAYKERRLTEKVLSQEDEELRFVDRCLDNLEGDGKKLLEMLLIDGCSSRRCAQFFGLSRYYVETESKRLLDVLARLFRQKYSSEG